MQMKVERRNARRMGVLHAVTLLGVLHVMGGTADASPIHRHKVHAAQAFATEASLGRAWRQFLSGGPSLWAVEKPPKFPSHLVLATSNGILIQTPFVAYLEWRRSLAPVRFDFYHPRVGAELAQLLSPTSAGAPTITTQGGGSTPPAVVQPQNSVPEPGTFAATLTLFASGLWWRGRLRRTIESTERSG
jgi:hypothetical protein